MRILFVDPHDSPRRGPWSRERWDLVVDMGKSSPWSADAWEKHYRCPTIRTDSYRCKVDDLRQVRAMFSPGHGRVVDEGGIDWWKITWLMFSSEALQLLVMRRLAAEIPPSAEVWATRRSEVVSLLANVLGRQPKFFGEGRLARASARASHYAGVARQFSLAQIKEIFFDKYDPGYRWRARFSRRSPASGKPVVLLPSAYVNVSRMAVAYAQLLPQQQFLLIATRQNAKKWVAAKNVEIRDLAEYADTQASPAEISALMQSWVTLKEEIGSSPELRVLSQAGLFDNMPNWIRDGISVRNAWLEVFRREPVRAVLCGDDSNRYTRLPVLIASRRGIPTIDFHHGALDGSCLLKELPCDLELAKNEMERDYLVRVCGLAEHRVVVAAPAPQGVRTDRASLDGGPVVLFSEPYDVVGMRSEEVYREILPPLCRVARENGREVIVKLHPFESRAERNRLLRAVLAPEEYNRITIVDGPLTPDLITNAWFGVTVESSTVLNCLELGVACFLCGWLALSPYGYSEQYARFGVGEVLESAAQIGDIPRRVEEFRSRSANRSALRATADPALLERWLTTGREGERQEQSSVQAIS